MSTLTIRATSCALESYEAFFLQLPEPAAATPVDRVDLSFGDVTQVYPTAFALMATYLARTRDRSRRPLLTRRFGGNPASAKLERAMDSVGLIHAIGGDEPPAPRPGSALLPLRPITRDTVPDRMALAILDDLVALAQPTRDAKEALFVILTELVENVVRHAEGETPAFICAQLSTQKRKLELCLADAGMGVRASLEAGKDPEIARRLAAGESALAIAVEAGTSSKGSESGLGFFVASAAATQLRGAFRLTSGKESLLVSREGRKHRDHAAWLGTVANLLLNIDKLGTLLEVYRTLPLPYPESERFLVDGRDIEGPHEVVTLRQEGSPYLGSRAAAAETRGRLLDAVRAGKVAVADLEGLTAITPGHADECFGLLLETLGEEQFRRSVLVRNLSEPGRLLIEAVLERRCPRRVVEVLPAAAPAAEAEEDPVAGDEPAEAEAEASIEAAAETPAESDEAGTGGEPEDKVE